MPVEVKMPRISMTMIEGVIVGWHKKENDSVREGEPLVEIETDKIVECLAASVSGVILKIMAKVGDVVPVDSPICLIGNASEAASDRNRAVRESDIEKEGAPVEGNDGIGSRRTVRLPRLNDRMAESLVIQWHKKEGESFFEGEPLLDVETETTLRSVAAPFAGAVGKILAFPGEVVSVGSDLCIVDADNFTKEEKMLRIPAGHAAESGGIYASPAARRRAAEKGISLLGVPGTGPGAMIVSADVPDVPARVLEGVEAGDEIVDFTGIRRRIAENLMMSKRNAADVTTVTDVDMERIRDLRRNLPLSYTSFIVRAAALALTEYPVMNASLSDEKIVVRKRININVAVSTERGLITPVVRDADRKNAVTIAEELDELANRGREGKISADDFKGGTFTVTNSGVFGALFFTPILNYPQCGVLGVGRIAPAPVVRGDAVVPALMMYLSLTYDHRVVDGEIAVRFLQRIRFYLENPDRMIVFSKKEKRSDG